MTAETLRDLRLASRQLTKNKSFLSVAILTLALGIGANTAIFTLIDAVMLKSLPVKDPQSLVRLGDDDNCCVIGGTQSHFSIFSYPLYTYLRDNTPELAPLAAFQAGIGKLGVRRAGENGISEPFSGEFVSGNYFDMLGVHPFRGRFLASSDDAREASPAAVISYRAWQHYGGTTAILGSSLILDGVAFTVVGVAPPEFFGDTMRPDPPDFWLPLATEPVVHKDTALLDHADGHWLYIIGRTLVGASRPAVEAKVNSSLEQWFMANAPPGNENERTNIAHQHITLTSASGGVSNLRQNYERDLTLLFMITAIVLLIACANVANLQLTRSAANAQQMAIRIALGARRHRIVRQVLTECLLLAIMGGVLGLAVSIGLSRLLIRFAFNRANYIPIGVMPDMTVLSAAFFLALLSGAAFGIAPAWVASGADPVESLRRKGRSAAGSSSWLQRSLVIVQAALSLALLVSAGLMVRTVRNLQNQTFGYTLHGLTVVDINAAFSNYSPERLAAVYDSIDERLHKIPGVMDVARVLYSPMSGNNWQSGVSVEEHPALRISPSWDRVSPAFFQTIGALILKGRKFDEHDTANSIHVAVVNQAFVDKVFPHEDPIGKRFGLGGPEHSGDYQIIGVVNNVLFRYPRQPDVPPMFFVPLLQMSQTDWHNTTMARSNLIGSVVLRVSGHLSDLGRQLQNALSGVDHNLTILGTISMPELLDDQLQHERLIARLAELLGSLALILAAIGLYGITSYSVVRRTSEIGVRTALGATQATLIWLVLGNAISEIGLGLLFGIPIALTGGRILSQQLYQVTASDPLVLLAALAVALLSGIAAAIIPALRASTVDPVAALRAEY